MRIFGKQFVETIFFNIFDVQELAYLTLYFNGNDLTKDIM